MPLINYDRMLYTIATTGIITTKTLHNVLITFSGSANARKKNRIRYNNMSNNIEKRTEVCFTCNFF